MDPAGQNPNTRKNYGCPACLSPRMQEFLTIEAVPVHCNLRWETQEEALNAPVADLRLGFCRTCGMIYNLANDPALLEYAGSYENSLHFSPSFQAYARDLAERLTERYELRGKDIVEIGSGDGRFLALLCRMGGNRGVGFEPSHRPDDPENVDVRIVRDFYSEAYSDRKVDLLCCRHVLEHLHRPNEFMTTVHRSLHRAPHSVVFFEVPNALTTFRNAGVWDLIYEHCSYFTTGSLAHLFQATGFGVLDLYTAYRDQFLCIEASPAGPGPSLRKEDSTFDVLPSVVAGFAEIYRRTLAAWSERLIGSIEQGRQVVVWGAGSKGVMFLNSVEAGHQISHVVDINPRKQGCYIPRTGQPIVGPEELRRVRPDTVVVMNPIYENEIRAMLGEIGTEAEVEVVKGPSVAGARSDR